MKKLAIVLFLFLFSTQSFSQIEDYIKTAVSSLEREVVSVDNLYLQGQFVKIVQSQSYEELLKAYHEKDFKRFTKRIYIDGEWSETVTIESDSIFISILEEMRVGLPNGMASSPSDTEIESDIDDYVTDYWVYTNKSGKKCEIRVYFLNGQLRNLGYWIYQ
jgi:hypothetical protein